MSEGLDADKVVFLAAMLGLGACGLVVGGIDLYDRVDFRLDGREAQMELADPKLVGKLPADKGLNVVDVRYLGPDGEVLVPKKRLWGQVAARVVGGGRVPVRYLKSEPQRALFDGEQSESPWVWLAVGAVGMAGFAYALKLLRRET